MRIAILTVGTQGDVRPFVALGRGLRQAGHDVRIAASPGFDPLVTGQGLDFAPLSGDFRALMARVQSHMERGTNPLLAVRIMRSALAEMAESWAAEGRAACQDADLIIASGLADLLGVSLAEALGKRFALAYLQPILPSREIPPVTLPPRAAPLPGTINLLLHHICRVVQWQVLKPAFNRHVRPGLGLPQYPWYGPRYPVGQRDHPIIYGYSRHVVAQPAGWPEYARIAGYWFLDEAETWRPSHELLAFLDAGPPPIYVGFGSMRTRDPQAATRQILEAIRLSGLRAVLALGWDGLAESPSGWGDHVCVIREAPHGWLFRHVALAVHHGGAGTTAAAVRAGIPSVVVPFLADQPFWAWQLERLGVAPPRLSHKSLSAQQLAEAITAATGAGMRRQAERLSGLVGNENGVRGAVATLAEWGLLSPSSIKDAESPAKCHQPDG
ncbi:MAG TPA: glycosyltransferase [Rhodopila sp.]|nr:glycosyltransferase [Rhodopila sp.]